MQSRLKDIVILTGVFVVVLFYFHFDLVSNLNSYYLGDFTDGIKNYYTPIYHVENDSTYNRFEGMNYPLGEHVVFTDNQPLLSGLIKAVSAIIPSIAYQTTGILNGLMLLSWLLTAILLNEIFVLYTQKRSLYLVVGALLIALLSPQIHRMGGHYALSYGFIIPLVWYQLLLFFEQQSTKRALLIGLTLTLAATIHLYYLGIGLSLVLAYWFISSILKGKLWKRNFRSVLFFLLQTAVPLLLVASWISLFDKAVMRPKNPFGFLEYRAHWEGIFLPIGKPMWAYLHPLFGPTNVAWEGISYLGLAGGIGLVFALVYAAVSLVFRWQTEIKQAQLIAFSAAGLVLLFSLGIPFIFNMEWLLNYLGPLKQFRGIARFSWVFFFVTNVVVLVFFYENLRKKYLLLLPLSLLALDAFQHQNFPFYKKHQLPELNNVETRKQHITSQFSHQGFQAILPLPYFHTGSENFDLNHQSKHILRESMLASVVTKLPLLAVQMSRTDIFETLNNLMLVYLPQEEPTLLAKMKSKQDFLVVYDSSVKLSFEALNLLRASTFLDSAHGIHYLKLPFEYFENRLIDQGMAALNRMNNDTISASPVQYRNFEDGDSNLKGLDSERAFAADLGTYTEIESIATDSTQKGITLSTSFWFKVAVDGFATTVVLVEGKKANNEVVFLETKKLAHQIIALKGEWALVHMEYQVEPNATYRTIIVNERFPEIASVDNIMTRLLTTNIYTKSDSTFCENNLCYKLDSAQLN